MLSLHFKKSFHQLDLHISTEIKNDFTALFGPSGAGKTTTLHCIAGITTPDTGDVVFNNRYLFSSTKKINVQTQKRDVGLVFQNSRLFPHLTVLENLCFGKQANERNKKEITFEKIIDAFNLHHLLKRKPDTCSGGEKQRIALGRALLAFPKYLLLDEPLAAVDVPERQRILAILRKIQDTLHLPVLFVSHDPGMVLNFAERVLILCGGKIIREGEPLSTVGQFLNNEIGSGYENLMQGTVVAKEKGHLNIRVGEYFLKSPAFNVQKGDVLYLQIPASEVLLATTQPQGLSAQNIIRGRVRSLTTSKGCVFVHIAIADSEEIVAEILPQTVTQLQLEPGKKVYAIIKATGIRKI